MEELQGKLINLQLGAVMTNEVPPIEPPQGVIDNPNNIELSAISKSH